MKRQLATILFTVLSLFCKHTFAQVQQVKLTSAADMRGAYAMLKQVADTGTGEFALNNQQMKLFTGKYVMYAHRRSETDSMADFGIGTYRAANGKVHEHMFFTASGPGDSNYELTINKKPDGYSQVIHFPSNNSSRPFILTEEYADASKKMVSPLDGAWRIKSLTVVDKDGKAKTYNSDDNAKQFKLYQSGNFMWANYTKDKATAKVETAYGYGTFTLDKPNQITETNISSTYASFLIGKPVTLKIKLTGKDMYEQTEELADRSKRTEVYERLK